MTSSCQSSLAYARLVIISIVLSTTITPFQSSASPSSTERPSTSRWPVTLIDSEDTSESSAMEPSITESPMTSNGTPTGIGNFSSSTKPCTNNNFTFGLYGIVAGAVCIVGLIGNTVSICVLVKDLKTPVASFQLMILAAADNLLVALWFFHYSVRYVLYYCGIATDGSGLMIVTALRLYTFPVLYMAQTVTIWLTVVIAFNRFMAVCLPYKAPRLHKIHIVRREAAIVTVFSVLYNIPRFFERSISFCWESPESVTSPTTNSSTSCKLNVSRTVIGASDTYRIVYTDTLYYLLSFALPLLVLTAMNACVIKVYRATIKRRRQMSSTYRSSVMQRLNSDPATAEASGCVVAPGRCSAPPAKRCRKADHESSVTLVMIVIVLVFIGCQALARIVQIVWGYEYKDCSQVQYYLIHISNTLEVFNSSLNFLVYCAFHRHFRTVLAGWDCRLATRLDRGAPTVDGDGVASPGNALNTTTHLKGLCSKSVILKNGAADVARTNHDLVQMGTMIEFGGNV